MDIKTFTTNLSSIIDAFYKTELIRDANIHTNFTGDKKDEFYKEILAICTNTALKLEELELSRYAAKAQNKIQLTEALKNLVQTESIAKGVESNARINRANCYVGFLQVVGNASEGAAIAEHTKNCLQAINDIDITRIEGYDEAIKEIRNDIQNQIKEK